MKQYNATFVMGNETVTVPFTAGEPLTPPANVPDFEGMKFACWDRDLSRTSFGDLKIRAVYTDTLSPAEMERCFRREDWYPEQHGYHDLGRSDMVYALIYQEYTHPEPSGAIAARVAGHFSNYLRGKSPYLDCSTNWAMPVAAANFAMAKQTPSIWSRLGENLCQKIDTFMEALTYLQSFACSDQNEFRTGPGMNGNFYKNWNANYAFGNIPTMVYVTYYFGDGDIELGAERVNTMLKAFDESVYERMIAAFKKYEWTAAYDTWTTKGPVAADGTCGPDAKTLLCHGGNAYGKDTYKPEIIVGLGSGKGVNNGGLDFTYSNPNPTRGEYKNIPLTRPEDILRSMVDYNYAWITKTDHHYDFNDGAGPKKVAWILDGTTTPYLGLDGMMYEFAIGVRSSTGYCNHNFEMLVVHLSATRALKRYTHKNGVKELLLDADGNSMPIYDYLESDEAWRRIQVGNEDFIYKLRHGYQCYARGNYGTSANEEHEYKSNVSYYIMKNFWRNVMKVHGDLPIAETYD